MKIFLKQNVFDAALDRIRLIFDEFPRVIVNISGGKDSTVVLNLALKVAEEKGRLPLEVMFVDQEAEWQTVIDHIRDVMSDPRIKPLWFQMPIKLFNATSTIDPWLYCWEVGKEDQWIRPKEPNAITENTFGTDRFGELFEAVLKDYPGAACHLAGVRADESTGRHQGLTAYACYKWITWGRKDGKHKGHYTFYPLYDWSYVDIWKAIHDNEWLYCPIYDYMYQYGIPTVEMRVSNVHHETAVRTLYYLQEIEADTWDKITRRISGINTAGQLQKNFYCPKDLPFMFNSWREYRDHLLENLVDNLEHRETFRKRFRSGEERYMEIVHPDLIKMQIASILTNDYHGTKESNFAAGHMKFSRNYRERTRG